MKQTLILLSFLLIFLSCEEYSQDTYQEYVVVESYAIANSPLPEVFVRTTGPSDQQYNEAELILEDANVQVVLLDESGAAEEVFVYMYSNEQQAYIAQDSNHKMLPTRTYRLDVDFENRQEIIQATTTIPDEFEILNTIPESVVYQSPEQLEIVLSKTEATQNQKVFVFTAIATEPTVENLTPFYLGVVEEDDDTDLDDFVPNSSGLINEASFQANEDGTITLQYPWIGIAFYGENVIVTHSVDENLLDLVRSQQVQLGGSTLSPGEIPNLIYNVDGGIGVFGSLSTDTVKTTFTRPF